MNVTRTITLNLSLMEKVKEIAEKEQISVNKLIVNSIKEKIEKGDLNAKQKNIP